MAEGGSYGGYDTEVDRDDDCQSYIGGSVGYNEPVNSCISLRELESPGDYALASDFYDDDNSCNEGNQIADDYHCSQKFQAEYVGLPNAQHVGGNFGLKMAITEPKRIKTSLCTFCLKDQKQTEATHLCEQCSTNEKKMCYKCLQQHMKFSSHTRVTRLSAEPESQKFQAEAVGLPNAQHVGGNFGLKKAITEPKRIKTSLCTYCLKDQKQTEATHLCQQCSTNEKKMCYICLQQHMKFSSHTRVTRLSAEPERSGVLRFRRQLRRENLPSNIRRIGISAQGDKYNCRVNDFSLMANGNLVMLDVENRCLKIFNTNSWQMLEIIDLAYQPIEITCLENDIVAVATHQKFHLEQLYPKLVTLCTFEEGRECYGLKRYGEKLYVLRKQPNRVSVYHVHNWKDIHFIKNIGTPTILNPYGMDVDSFRETIFVSDRTQGVYAINSSSTIIWNVPVQSPRGVAFDGIGNVYVCSIRANQIIKISLDYHTAEVNKVTVFLSEEHGIASPCRCFYDRLKSRLLVGMYCWNDMLSVAIKPNKIH